MKRFPRRGSAAAAVLALAFSAAPARAADPATVELFATRCQVCHGVKGRSPDPDRNLADGRWIHGDSLAAARRVITEGVPGKAMVSFKDQLTPEQILALARYVRSFSARAAAAAKAAPARTPPAKAPSSAKGGP